MGLQWTLRPHGRPRKGNNAQMNQQKRLPSPLSVLLIVMAVGAPLAQLVCFPPQRRSGNWTDMDGHVVVAPVAQEFDRVEFGYIPSFRWFGNVGIAEEKGYLSKLGLEGRMLQHDRYRWEIDWLWVAILAQAVFFLFVAAWATAYARQLGERGKKEERKTDWKRG